jgi:hypothetical protein
LKASAASFSAAMAGIVGKIVESLSL